MNRQNEVPMVGWEQLNGTEIFRHKTCVLQSASGRDPSLKMGELEMKHLKNTDATTHAKRIVKGTQLSRGHPKKNTIVKLVSL